MKIQSLIHSVLHYELVKGLFLTVTCQFELKTKSIHDLYHLVIGGCKDPLFPILQFHITWYP